jgi:hypothetical protein
MPESLIYGLALGTKMAITAMLVVLASLTAERFGSLIGAMVATLPIAAGPAYVFVALDHDPAFIASSALGSLVGNAATIVLCAVYTIVAQHQKLAVSLALSLVSWIAFVAASRSIPLSLPDVVAANIVALLICLPVGWKFRRATMPPAIRRWYDVPLRAAMVVLLVASVVTLSSRLGPTATGLLALFPVVLVCLVLIFQPRIGGPATATITANAIVGLAGYGIALVVLNLSAVPLGTPTALSLALTVSVLWNLFVVLLRRRGLAMPQRSRLPSSPP